ncbi:MAG: acyltransferase family protein [Pseudomonadota bacterium]
MKIEKNIAGSAPAIQAARTALSDHPAYRRDIDGLRAIAVLSVVAFHAFPAFFRGGFIGVDIFFIISGFLISSIIQQGLAQGDFSFRTFYARRIRRIFPALLLVLAACFAFGWLALFPDEFKQLGKHMFGGAGFISNFMFWNEVGYFDRTADTKPLLHLWSLGIEEQFYIFWPLLLLLAFKRRLDLLTVTATLALASFLLNVGGISQHASATFYSPLSRAWELLMGAALAGAMLRRPGAPQLPGSANQRAIGGLLLLALGLAIVTRERHFPGWLALLPTLGAALLISAGPQAWFNRVVLSNRILVGIGLISYPLYLWHWPLLSFAQIVEGKLPSPAIRAGAVLLALVLAGLTYLLLERPLRLRRPRAAVAVLAALMACVAFAGACSYANDGLAARTAIVNNAQNQKALVLVEDVANASACKQRYGFASLYEYCQQAFIDRPPTVVLIGDSHAYHVMAGLTRYYTARGENLLMLGTRIPFWGLAPGNDDYQKATQPMLELALNTPSVKTVVFSTHLRLSAGTPEGLALIEAARDTYRRFLAAGKQVIVMDDVPMLQFDPRACIGRPGVIATGTKSPCAIARADAERQTPEHAPLFKKLMQEFPTIPVFDPTPALCDQRYCYAMLNGKLMYRDGDHLSYDGDLYIGSKFAAQMQARGAAQ